MRLPRKKVTKQQTDMSKKQKFEESLPKVNCKLVGEDGNAFAILGCFKKAAKEAKWPQNKIDKVIRDAMGGDYNHLIFTISKYCKDSGYQSNKSTYMDYIPDEDDYDDEDDY